MRRFSSANRSSKCTTMSSLIWLEASKMPRETYSCWRIRRIHLQSKQFKWRVRSLNAKTPWTRKKNVPRSSLLSIRHTSTKMQFSDAASVCPLRMDSITISFSTLTRKSTECTWFSSSQTNSRSNSSKTLDSQSSRQDPTMTRPSPAGSTSKSIRLAKTTP